MDATLQKYGFEALGTHCGVQVYETSRVDAKNLVRRIAAEIVRIDRKYSASRRDSFTTEINFSAGSKLGIKLDKETQELLQRLQRHHESSEGLFDPTVNLLRRVWDFKKPRMASPEEIEKLLPRVGFHKLSWRGARFSLPAGTELDFSSTLGAYAADCAAGVGRGLGITSGIVNVAGDYAVIGPHPKSLTWPVGIADPERQNALLGKLEIGSGGLASSGDYNGSIELEGQHYQRLINPKTGMPASGLRAVSMIAKTCFDAAALAEIAMLKDADEAISWLETMPESHAYMTHAGELHGKGLQPIKTASPAA